MSRLLRPVSNFLLAAMGIIIVLFAVVLSSSPGDVARTSPTPSLEPSAVPSASADPSSQSSPSPSNDSSGATFLLTVTISGAENGVIQSTPAGIDCPTRCSARFPAGTIVTLTPRATPPTSGTETLFRGFSGGCAGTSCSVTITGTTAVSATFANISSVATLTVVKTGPRPEGLLITSNTSDFSTGIYCETRCSWDFPIGTVVTLYLALAPDTLFAGWSGECSGTGVCSFTITAATTVTALSALP